MIPVNETTARGLLERAIAQSSKPALTSEDVDLLMAQAVGDDDTYSVAALNRVAALGWTWKSGLVADQYDVIAGGGGKRLERPDWYDHCMRMAAGYRNGDLSVDGAGGRAGRSGIGSIQTIGVLAADDEVTP